MAIIQLPEWDGWRIKGEKLDWQLQKLTKDKSKEGGVYWRGTNFWPSAEYAIAHAYERTLRECGKEFASLSEPVDESRRIKEQLIAAVRKAVRS